MPRRADHPPRRWRLALWLAMSLAAIAGGARAFDLGELMTLLGNVEQSRAAFEETKHLAALTVPIVRRGTLRFDRPDRLEMEVDSPFRERMVVLGNTLTIENKRGTRRIDLAGQPAAAALVASIRATLAGDRLTLGRHFDARLSGAAPRWVLTLDPLEPSLASVIRRITIDGAQARLTRIEVDERLGDRTILEMQTVGDGKR